MSELYRQHTNLTIEQKANNLIGKTFKEIESETRFNDGTFELKESAPGYCSQENQNDKLYCILANYFGSDKSKDLNGYIIKILPYKNIENQCYVTENLFLSQIKERNKTDNDFYSSDLYKYYNNFLLIFYNQNDYFENPIDYKIAYISFFTPSHIDNIIIQQDYDYIINNIKTGNENELSESNTMYLSISTKDNSSKIKHFCYKKAYLSFILNNCLITEQNTDSIINDEKKYSNTTSFEEYIYSLVNIHIGKTDKALCKEFNLKYNNGKAQWITIVYRILGIKTGNAAEFIKSNIIVKAIRIEEDGSIIQSSSLPPIKFLELANENWEDSILFNYFEQTKFFFVVFKKENDCYVLKGCQLWNMPYDDLNTVVYDGWNKIKQTINNGIQFKIKTNKKGEKIVKNNLPSKSDNRIIHMRPHASHAYYKLSDGFTEGKVADGDLLPDGQYMTKQSFWLNNSYIVSILKDELKN